MSLDDFVNTAIYIYVSGCLMMLVLSVYELCKKVKEKEPMKSTLMLHIVKLVAFSWLAVFIYVSVKVNDILKQ